MTPRAEAPCTWVGVALKQREGQVWRRARAGGDEQVVLRPEPQAAVAWDFVRCTCVLWGLEATLDLVVSELAATPWSTPGRR